MPKVRVPNLIKGVKPSKVEKEKQNIFVIFLFIVINALVVILFYNNSLMALLSILILSILFIFNYKSNMLVAVYIFGMFAAFFEMLAVTYGVLSYTNPDFGNIPLWSFLLWGNISIAIYRMAIELERIGFHK